MDSVCITETVLCVVDYLPIWEKSRIDYQLRKKRTKKGFFLYTHPPQWVTVINQQTLICVKKKFLKKSFAILILTTLHLRCFVFRRYALSLKYTFTVIVLVEKLFSHVFRWTDIISSQASSFRWHSRFQARKGLFSTSLSVTGN